MIAIPLVLLGGGGSQLAFPAESNGWHFEATPYAFAAGMDGDVGVRNVTTEVEASFSDIADNLDHGFMVFFTASKGPWSFGLETDYLRLSEDSRNRVTGPFGQVVIDGELDVTSKMYIYQGSVLYRLLDDSTAIDLVGAVRYMKLETKASITIETTPGIVFPGGARNASGSDSWMDVAVGVRALHALNQQWSLVGYADVGGGGSDRTYQFMLGANWEFASDFIAKAGYRQLYWDYQNEGTVWDITASGPYIGLGIQF